jgi:hypothetical protein
MQNPYANLTKYNYYKVYDAEPVELQILSNES